MPDSFADRIAAAESEKRKVVADRDSKYPGSREWERLNDKVAEWEGTLRDLRSERAG